MKKLTLLLAIIVLMMASSAFAQKTWTGATSTAWNLAGNWSPSGIPTASDNVTIPSAPANQPVINGTTTPVCNNLTVNSGATLTISATSTANAQLNVAGTVTFNGHLSIGGVLARTGKLIATNVVWNSTSTVNGYFGGRMELSGNWTFASGSNVDMGFCFVTFNGTASSYIYNYSANSKFGSVTFGKTTTATTFIGTGSNATLSFGSGFSINADNTFTGGVNITTVVQGNIVANGRLNFFSGTMRLERASGTQAIQMAATNNRVNNLVINCGGTVTLDNQLDINGNLTIESGTFDPQNNKLIVQGNWINLIGPDYFIEGTGRVILTKIINKGEKGAYDQYINYTEHFNILEVDNPYGDVVINSASAVVSCNQYDYTTGGIKVQAGTFTANDLFDNGIFGRYTLQTGGTINLTNNDGYVDLNGATITITGGVFNVYGGTTESYWPFGGASSITMSGGVLSFTQGIRVQSSPALTYNITGGTIKTARSFTSNKSNFNPTGGTVEMYGPADASLYLVSGSTLYSVNINKGASAREPGDDLPGIVMIDRETGKPIEDESSRANTVNLTNPATFEGNFTLSAGTFNSNSHTIQAKRDWTNNAGAGSFNPSNGRVIFNGGNYHQYCYNETFNILEVAKVSGGAFRLSSGTSVTCAVYDWTAGSIDVLTNGGTFTALDLFDNGIYGSYFVNAGGTINLYQDASQWIDLCGNITFTGGGTINVYGGSSTSYWPYNNNASLTMNAGVLDFKNQGIFVTTSAHTLTTSITGGTIRTAGSFACSRTDFNPTGGTIELYGSQNANLSMTAGSLYNLSINKSVANNVSLTSNATLTGGLTVDGGTLNLNAKTLATGKESAVNDGGVLHLNAGSTMLIQGSYWINVNSGGLLKVIGAAGNPALISRNGTAYHIYININSGATISARNAWFHYFNPLKISSGGIIDPVNPFDDCQFRYTATGMLWVENEQTLLIRNTEFLTPATGYNVRKSVNNGELTFKDATGNYAGAAYENDPYNRIHWTVTQPGLWTGAVSTNWHTAGNWDDGLVPTSTVDVTIPPSAPYMPLISTHANCKNLTLNGTLTINDPTLTVSGNANISGNLILNYELARFVVMGDLTWQSGSTASQNDIDTEIQVYGNFTFNAGSNVQLNNGGVRFRGTANKNIINHSANSWFYNLNSSKTSGAAIDFAAASTLPLKVTGSLSTETGAKFKASSGLNIDLKHNLVSYGTFEIEWSRIVFSGTDQYIQPNVNDYFYHLNFNQSGTVTINTSNSNVLQVRGGITILSGVINAGSSTIKVRSGWVNEVGPGAFIASNSRVIFEGFLISDIYNNENFNILEINKSAGNVMVNGATVTCNSFDWTNGQLRVANGGVFTAYDLADDGIFADIELQSGSTVNLYQDIYQRVDLGGKLWIMGGSTVNVFGGNGWSQWPYGADATLYMTDGTLDFKDQGINVNFMSPNTLTLDLTGGVIRTPVGFFCNRPDFDPEPSTLEIYGPGNSSIDMQSGLLWDVNINKTGTEDEVLINSNLTANSVIVNSGVLKSTPNSILIFKNAYAYGNGTIWLTEGTDIKLKGSHEFAANGGKFILMGEPDNYVSVGRHGTNYVNLYIGNGGNISARYAHFSYLLNGPFVMNTGIVDADNAFAGCSFENGAYYQFRIENNQDLTIQDAHFPTASAPYNAGKLSNQGSVTFFNATGAFAGEAFEDDPHNRIHWVTTVPGLWIGAISTDWFTAGNWSDGNVPTIETNVLIPADRMFMPVISSGTAYCNDLTLNGTLTLGGANLDIEGNLEVNGHFETTLGGEINIEGDVEWNQGSTASIHIFTTFYVYGNWRFNAGADVQIDGGTVFLLGNTIKTLINHSSNGHFNSLFIYKSGGAYVEIPGESDQPIHLDGVLRINVGSQLIINSVQELSIGAHLYNDGNLHCNFGTIHFTGHNININCSPYDIFNNVIFDHTGTATLMENFSVFSVHGDLTFNSGVFNPGDNTIKLWGSWINNAGPGAFNKAQSRVIFTGAIGQFCSSEDFNILEIDKSLQYLYLQNEDVVTCNSYDWTNGGLWIAGNATFIANDLADDGIYGFMQLFDGYVELHQDNTQSVDLRGQLTISGGEMKVFGGNDISRWGMYADGHLTMSGGVLDFGEIGINVVEDFGYSFTSTITGGIIRTQGVFWAQSDGFSPSGGTVELYGESNATILTDSGSQFWNLQINKSVDYSNRVSMYSTVVANELLVTKGLCEFFSTYTFEIGNIIVQDGGWLANNGATVHMSGLVVNSGGYLTNEGFEDVRCIYTSLNPGEKYSFTLESGSNMLVFGTLFENMDENGIYIAAGAGVTNYEPFINCEFRNGAAGPYPLLVIDNDQDLIIENAIFPTNTWGGQYNVRKNVDQGSVTFVNYSGDFGGSAFEDDPYNRINWQSFVPGLWTGLLSSDWNTPGNWGNMQVPDEFTDITIPADAPNMPVVNSPDAICYSITIDAGAGVTIGSGKLFVNNTLIIFGNLTMTNPASEIDAFKLSWESGSTENITAGEIKVKWWYFREGTLAKLGAGNTVTVTSGIVINDLEAEFGSLVISTFGKSHEQRALYTLRVSGDCLIKTGSNWNTNMDIIIAGNFTIEMGSGWTAFENDVAITVGGNLNLGGHLRNFSEITVNGNFELAEFGELKLSGGTFTCNHESEDWIELNGKLIMTNLPGVNFKHSNVRIGETFVSGGMLSGIFRVGKSFEATHHNSFHPGGVEIHFTNTNSGHTLNVTNGNYLSSMYITKYGGELTLANHLIIEGDHVNLNAGNLITAGFDMTLKGDIFIRDNSRLIMSPGSGLNLGGELMLRDGGTLETVGLADNYNTINSNITISNPSYNGNINSFLNGKISAAYTHFTLNNKPNGILVESTGLVDPTNSFHYCSFSSETMATTLLTIDNSQDIVINTAHFPDFLPSGFNAAKLTNGGSVTFNNATGVFAGSLYENDPFNRIHWETTLFSQPISIPAGWSGISSYILPSQPALEDVFAPIADELIIAQTMTQMYYPGQNINQIGNWESHSAYKVKTTAACMLNIEGELETNLAVQLNAGWNLLPVVTPDGSDPVNLFMPVNGFVIVKDVAGTGVFWPQYNINSIGYIFPGKAYYVLMTAPGVVDYTGMKSSQNLTGSDKNLPGFQNLEGFGIQPTPSTHTIAILPEALKGFDQGTIIGAFGQSGNCYGATVYDSEFISLTVFGDDPTTAEKDGFFEGEMIFFKNLPGFGPARAGLEGLEPTFDQNLPQSIGLFTENGLSAITGFESSTGISFGNILNNVNIYPNPSEGVVNITGLVGGTKITIADARGQVVLETETHNSDLFTLDLSGSNPGVYFVNIQYNGHNIFRKIVLR